MEIKDKYMQNLVTDIVRVVAEFPGKDGIESIILTGSLGRDEGTFHFNENGEFILDSDVEIALVYKKGCKKQAATLKEILINKFKEEMNPMTISISRVNNKYNFNYSIIKPKYSSIFMYDLYNGSKIIWGTDLIKNCTVKYDKYEAKRIVANRIGELMYLKHIEKAGSKQNTQWECKLLLAIGTAYCIINDKYNTKYSEQYNIIYNTGDALGDTFIADYTQAYEYLRLGKDEYNVPYERLHQYVGRINNMFIGDLYSKPRINSMSRKLKYIISCIKHGKGLNPFNCEVTILDGLITSFINRDNDKITEYSNYWKYILY